MPFRGESSLTIDKSAPLIIVGAGIAGLSAALCLAHFGFSVEIYERAATLQEAGAGLQLSPNAMRVLGRLGLADDLVRKAVVADKVTLRSARSGRPIATVPVGAGDGTTYLSIHRADLQAALLLAAWSRPGIELHLGYDLVRVRQEGARTILVFRHEGEEKEVRAALVIAADGVRSKIASEVGFAPPQAARSTAWRMTLETERLEATDRPIAGVEAWLGSGRHAVIYPIRQGSEINIVLIVPSESSGDGTPGTVSAARLQREFRAWDPRLARIISKGERASAWPMHTVDPHRPWSKGSGIVLVGDAAHAMLPYAAQGAAMAIEDAWVLAYALARAEGAGTAIELYQAMRQPRVERVRSRVRFHDTVYHLQFPLSLGRDAVLGLRSPDSLRRDLAWLYGWTPPVA
ncbi:FAD-dependent monooxygenase [Consotaella salsifontis]|uniref:Salicylate hydroxylase n=1 Tax=Consotaella salsifontis TaxID=1365950 RepID=A0A1T4L7F6_9HYPH|nr:FAD-dependent monooxygenase [Consotaella salsifontis]SJZ50527.1 salicylate hydroxylase [Consotaella salsifontis]